MFQKKSSWTLETSAFQATRWLVFDVSQLAGGIALVGLGDSDRTSSLLHLQSCSFLQKMTKPHGQKVPSLLLCQGVQ